MRRGVRGPRAPHLRRVVLDIQQLDDARRQPTLTVETFIRELGELRARSRPEHCRTANGRSHDRRRHARDDTPLTLRSHTRLRASSRRQLGSHYAARPASYISCTPERPAASCVWGTSTPEAPTSWSGRGLPPRRVLDRQLRLSHLAALVPEHDMSPEYETSEKIDIFMTRLVVVRCERMTAASVRRKNRRKRRA